jgi:hypothetical protein
VVARTCADQSECLVLRVIAKNSSATSQTAPRRGLGEWSALAMSPADAEAVVLGLGALVGLEILETFGLGPATGQSAPCHH